MHLPIRHSRKGLLGRCARVFLGFVATRVSWFAGGCSRTDGKTCAGHGKCLVVSAGDGDEVVAVCQCELGWGGTGCSQAVCPLCVHGSCVDGKCKCFDGWNSTDCSERACAAGCEVNGKCEDGICVCRSGWAGIACSVNATLCPNNCNGRGRCTKDGCACDQVRRRRMGWVRV